MNSEQYLIDSGRTAAGTVCWDNVKTHTMLTIMAMFMDQGEALDQVKKSIFYNRPFFDPSEPRPLDGFDVRDVVSGNIFHGIVGVATEGSELVELIVEAAATGAPISREKLMDETGDVLWYIALILRAIGSDFDEVMERNINKLMIRFPEKFEAALANNKDDAKEASAFQD